MSNNEDETSASYDRFDQNATWTAGAGVVRVGVRVQRFRRAGGGLFEYVDYEWEEPETGEEVFVLVDDPFVWGWRYWGAEVRYRF